MFNKSIAYEHLEKAIKNHQVKDPQSPEETERYNLAHPYIVHYTMTKENEKLATVWSWILTGDGKLEETLGKLPFGVKLFKSKYGDESILDELNNFVDSQEKEHTRMMSQSADQWVLNFIKTREEENND